MLVAPWVLYLAVCDMLLSLVYLVKTLTPDFVYSASCRIAYSVCNDGLPMKESAVIVSNHATWADAMGMGMGMGMPMRTFGGIVRRRWPMWLISFGEATRFTPNKYNKSIVWCKQNGRLQPLHLLYLRTKGFATTVQQLRVAPHVKAVYDFAIAYHHKDKFHVAPDMWETLKVPDHSGFYEHDFHIHIRRFPLGDLPRMDGELAKWLEQRWVETGEWLDALKTE
ncbi:1-acyl-sn-glycerol-3-phosphate acyltransferase [Daldinia grandis]|nr:1-acyl-sn-glycerol-3-phosphate acyltransferase [Daldinia grandis]